MYGRYFCFVASCWSRRNDASNASIGQDPTYAFKWAIKSGRRAHGMKIPPAPYDIFTALNSPSNFKNSLINRNHNFVLVWLVQNRKSSSKRKKYLLQCLFCISNNLMKVTTKRKRSKLEIKEEKKMEERKKMEIDRKLEMYDQQNRELQ